MLLYAALVIGISFLLVIVVRKIREHNELKKKINRFPGPQMTPLIGDIEFLTKSNDELFYVFRERASKYKGGFRTWYFLEPTLSFADAKNIERIISHVKHNEKSWTYTPLQPWLGTGLLTSSGQKWHNRRKILTPTFHFTILQEFLKIFNTEAKSLVEVLRQNSNKEIDIKPHICQFTLNSICETAMGISLKTVGNQETYRNSLSDFVDVYIERMRQVWLTSDLLFYFSKFYQIQKRAINVLHNFSTKVIAERKKYITKVAKSSDSSYSGKKRVAMLDLMLMNQLKNGDIDDEGIREEVDTFTFEGHDTTALSLTYTLMILANHRECQDRVYEEIISIVGDSDRELTNADFQDMKYLEMCIKESLRLYPSVPFIGRIAGADIETEQGLIIPKGCDLFLLISELHMDPEVFPEPQKFDPDRFLPENSRERHPFAYIPFSGGPRNCIGQKFAMLELKSCLTEILRNFILEPVDTPNDLVFSLSLVLRNNGPVRVKFVPRN